MRSPRKTGYIQMFQNFILLNSKLKKIDLFFFKLYYFYQILYTSNCQLIFNNSVLRTTIRM